MRTLLYVVLGLVVLLVGAVVALPYVVPQDYLRSTVAGQLERATGREIALTGDVGLAVLPRPAASLGGLSIAGAEGVAGPPLVRLDGLDAELALVPLLSGNVQVDRFVLRGLTVELVVDEQGRANWAATGAPAADTPPATGDGTGAGPGAPVAMPAVSLGDVRLVDGAVRYTDRGAGTTRTFENIDGTVEMTALDAPLSLDLAGDLDGRGVQLQGRLTALAPLLRGEGTGVDASLTSDGLDVTFDGEVTVAGAPAVSGDVDVQLRDAPATLGWLAAADVAVPVETASVAGALTASPARIALDGLDLSVDDLSGSGEVAVALDTARPKVTGRLDLGAVDLASFGMGGPADQAAEDGGATGDGGAPQEGWSRAPIGYTHPPVDLDVALSVEGLRAPPLRFGAGALAISNDAERLLITLERLGFYDGDAAGSLRVAPAGDGVAVAPDLRLEGFRTGPLLADLAGTGFLDGRADLDLALEAQGASQHALVASADGGGGLTVDRAVLKGLQGKPELEALRALLALGGEPGAPLRIASAEGTLTITDGVVSNRDLVATTANLRLTGDGRIDLVNRAIPGYTLTPEATGALAGAQRLQAVLVPLIVSGPFDALRVRPDPSAVAGGAVEEVERALEAAGEKARQGDLEGAAESIINEGLGGALEKFGIRP